MPTDVENNAGYLIVHTGEILARLQGLVLDGRYRMVDKSGEELPVPDQIPVRVPALGHGGFGAVVRTKDRIELDRAVKLLDPRKAISKQLGDHTSQFYTPDHTPGEDDVRAISTQFQHEIRHTNARPFQHILPIIDYGRLTDLDDTEILYYVSPFVDGDHIDQFFRERTGLTRPLSRTAKDELHDLLLVLIDDLLAAIEELEDASVIHMDIKPSNLMVLPCPDRVNVEPHRKSGVHRLFVIDLGAARSARVRSHTVPLIITPYFFPVDLLPILKYSAGRVSHAALLSVGSRIDLYAAGRVLEMVLFDRARRKTPLWKLTGTESIERERQKEQLSLEVLEDDFEVLEGLVGRLMDIGPAGFVCASAARLAFQALARRGAHSVFASRVLTDQAPGIRIRVGRALIRIAPPFNEIVDHPVFQRLRRMQQLALISEIFPDATHTRFAHSLHTFHLAKQFIRGLYRDVQFRIIFTQRDVDHVLAAALLHDIGQYPFSHTIEDLRKLGDLSKNQALQSILYDQELAQEFLSRAVDGSRSIHDILVERGFSVESILYLIQKTKKSQTTDVLSVGRDLISGLIDVDRVAYLLGDSDRSGLSFGAAMDVDGLVEALCVKPSMDGQNAGLAVDECGISAVEAMLTAVYWMYRNVYWRHTNRGFMAAVKYVVQQLLRSGEFRFDQYKELTYGRSEWDALLHLHDRFQAVIDGTGKEIYNPLGTIVSHRRFGYRRILSFGAEDGSDELLYEKFIAATSPDFLELAVEAIEDATTGYSNVRSGDVLIDVPLKKRLKTALLDEDQTTDTFDTGTDFGARSTVWVRMRRREGRDRWRNLFDRSPLAGLLGKIEDHSGRKIRVFLSRELLRKLPSRSEEQLAIRIKEGLAKLVNP